jgi:AraC-like DNA-binding protein
MQPLFTNMYLLHIKPHLMNTVTQRKPCYYYNYQLTNYNDWIQNFGTELKTTVVNNRLILPQKIGNGFAQTYKIEEGFSALINNYFLSSDVTFERAASDDFELILYFFELDLSGSKFFTVNNDAVQPENKIFNAIRVVNSMNINKLELQKNTGIKSLSIHLSNQWIQKNTTPTLEKVFTYIKKSQYLKQFVQAKQQKIINEIINLPINHPYGNLFVKSRVMRLLDKIFEEIVQRDDLEAPEKISEETFLTLQKIEYLLIQNYNTSFLSIEKLARIALMSESKLKKTFKQAFGMGLYEYYQKNRMHKAKEMLMLGKYSVGEIGANLGYQNLSNFSAAFKKEFKCLPKEVSMMYLKPQSAKQVTPTVSNK